MFTSPKRMVSGPVGSRAVGRRNKPSSRPTCTRRHQKLMTLPGVGTAPEESKQLGLATAHLQDSAGAASAGNLLRIELQVAEKHQSVRPAAPTPPTQAGLTLREKGGCRFYGPGPIASKASWSSARGTARLTSRGGAQPEEQSLSPSQD